MKYQPDIKHTFGIYFTISFAVITILLVLLKIRGIIETNWLLITMPFLSFWGLAMMGFTIQQIIDAIRKNKNNKDKKK